MNKPKKILKGFIFVILGLVILITIASTINNRIGNCEVEGEIKGLGTTIAMISGGTDSYEKTFIKFVLVFNDKFSFKAKLDESGGGRFLSYNMLFRRASGWPPLWMRSKAIDFDINPSQVISIKGFIKDYSVDYLISGNEQSEDASKFRQNNLSLLERETKMILKIDSLEQTDTNQNNIDSLYKVFEKIRTEYNSQRLKYAIQNPTHEISASFLQSQGKDSIIKYFPILSENVLATYKGKMLKKRFLAYKENFR